MRTIRSTSPLARLASVPPALLAAGCAESPAPGAAAAGAVSIPGPEGLPLHAEVHPVDGAGATVLFFHQGGGSPRGEQANLVPTLVQAGYRVVATDLHGGGGAFGEPNRALAGTPEPTDLS